MDAIKVITSCRQKEANNLKDDLLFCIDIVLVWSVVEITGGGRLQLKSEHTEIGYWINNYNCTLIKSSIILIRL